MARNLSEIFPVAHESGRIAPNRQEYGANRRYGYKRFIGAIPVQVSYKEGKERVGLQCSSINFSNSGVQLRCPHGGEGATALHVGQPCVASFNLTPGIMPESFESRIRIKGRVTRVYGDTDETRFSLRFNRTLKSYLDVKYWLRNVVFALLLIAAALGAMVWMRRESIVYFTFHPYVYLYSLTASFFLLSRYFFALLYRPVPVDPDFTPGVSIIIPCYNEEEWIHRTILGCVNQDYPPDKFEVLVVDDGSKDNSLSSAVKTVERIRAAIPTARCRVLRQPRNLGKRHALAAGALQSEFELLTFVDSDSFLEPDALRHLVQPFRDPHTGAVAGRTEVYNKWTNYLTKMQAVRYYVSFRFFKAAESIFDAVTCLSGPLACYRKSLVLKYLDAWCGQTFLGRPATFGDDRSMTNFILAEARTVYQDTAVCHTIVPSSLKVFLKQQLRWKRSWLRESIRAAGFMWKKEPAMSLSFYMGLFIPVVAPLIVVFALVIAPLTSGFFPAVYVVGLACMAAFMSAAYLLVKKSRLWIYGFFFCLFYLVVLMWQMPWAVATFSSSDWGTRNTSLEDKDGQKCLPSPHTVMPEEIPVGMASSRPAAIGENA